MKKRVSNVCLAAVIAVVGMTGCKNKSEGFCRQARTELNQMVASGWQASGVAPAGMPEEPFMSQCKALRPEVAHCAVVSWAMDHPDCAQYRDQLRAIAPH